MPAKHLILLIIRCCSSNYYSEGLPVLYFASSSPGYSSQSCNVSWDGASSDSFNVSNGVRQGGVLSPVLFAIYMDILLNKLKECGVGCYWDGLFVGAICYADDLILLAPCPSALRTMPPSLCESFANSYGLKFNAGKTQLIHFGLSPSDKSTTAIYLCGELLVFLNSVCHLGHILTYNLSDNDDIVFKSQDLLKKVNLCSVILSSAVLIL